MSNARMLAKLFRLALGLPTDPTKTYGYKPNTGWVEQTAGDGDQLLTKENFLAQLEYGALGVSDGLGFFYNKNVGAAVWGRFARVFPWLSTTPRAGDMVQGGAYFLTGGGATETIARNDDGFIMSTGTAPSTNVSLSAASDATPPVPERILNAVSGAGAVGVSIPTLSVTAQAFFVQVDIDLAGVGSVAFQYTHSTNGGRWSVRGVDTGVTVVAATDYRLEVVADSTTAVAKVNGVTVASFPRSGLSNTGSMYLAATIAKTSGSTARTLVVTEMGCHSSLV